MFIYTPFTKHRGQVNPVRADMTSWRNQKIGKKYLKEMVRDPTTLSTFIIGKKNVQVLSGQEKGDGLLGIIHSVMREKYPDTPDKLWTPQMMREIKKQIMNKMKSFCESESESEK